MSQRRIPLSDLLLPDHPGDAIVAFGASKQDDDEPITRAQFVQDVTHLATQLNDHPGQRWALFQPDAYRFAVGFFGLLHAHKTAILPPNAQAGTLHDLADHVDGFLVEDEGEPGGPHPRQPAAATPSPVGRERGTHASASLGLNTRPKVASPLPCDGRGVPSEARRGEGKTPIHSPLAPLALASAHFELFTSGSTGRARCIPKRLLQLDTELVSLHEQWGETFGQSAVISTVSQQHIYGLLFRICWPLSAGAPFCRQNVLFPPSLVEMIRGLPKERPAAIVSTPAHLKRCAAWIDLTPLAPRVAMSVSSGGPLAASTAHQIEATLGAPPYEVLGSSETGGVAWRQQHSGAALAHDEDSSGGSGADIADDRWRPLPRVEVRRDEEGALCVRSPFAPGEAEDWYAMGDQIEMADDGSFRLLGRSDRIVKIAEKRLSLQIMEERLLQHPFVEECAVLLLPQPTASTPQTKDEPQTTPTGPTAGPERPLGALIMLTQEGKEHLAAERRQATTAALRQALSRHFERVLLPKRWRFVDAIPQDPQGKRQRHALEAMFAAKDQLTQPAQTERGDRTNADQ